MDRNKKYILVVLSHVFSSLWASVSTSADQSIISIILMIFECNNDAMDRTLTTEGDMNLELLSVQHCDCNTGREFFTMHKPCKPAVFYPKLKEAAGELIRTVNHQTIIR